MSYTPKHLGHLVMRVRDMERSLDFYTRVMGLTIMERSPSGTVFMSANTEKSHELAIRAIGMDAGGPDHSIVGQAHMAWQMETFEDLQELYDRLLENSVRINRISDHGVSLGVYLLDPGRQRDRGLLRDACLGVGAASGEGPVRRHLPAEAARTWRWLRTTDLAGAPDPYLRKAGWLRQPSSLFSSQIAMRWERRVTTRRSTLQDHG